MAPTLKEKLTKILIDKKLLKQEDIEKAVSLQREKGGSLSDLLVKLGFISKSDLIVTLSQKLGIPPINLSRFKIDPAVIKLIPKKIAKHYKILPISKMGGTLMIAMADPLNIFAIDDIKNLTGSKISPVITTDKDIEEAIGQYYGEDGYMAIEKIVANMEEEAQIRMVEEKEGVSRESASDLLRMTQDAPVVKITNLLLAEAVNLRASDILVEPMEKELRIRYRVDGILQEAKRPTKALDR